MVNVDDLRRLAYGKWTFIGGKDSCSGRSCVTNVKGMPIRLF